MCFICVEQHLCSLEGFSRLGTLKMEAVNPEHRWIHPSVSQQHEGAHGNDRMQASVSNCAANNMNLVETPGLLPPDEVDVFFHHLDSSGNAPNWSYTPGGRAYRPSMCQMAAHGATAFQDPQSQSGQGSCSRVFLPTARVPPGQVCRPHFHTPIQWIESKPAPGLMSHGCSTATPPSVWCPSFQQGHRPSPVPVSMPPSAVSGSMSLSHSSAHLFPFPPTPPKDINSGESGMMAGDIFSYGSDEKARLKAGMPLVSPRPDTTPFTGALPHYVGSELNMSSFGPLPGLPGLMANRNFPRTRTKSRSNSG